MSGVVHASPAPFANTAVLLAEERFTSLMVRLVLPRRAGARSGLTRSTLIDRDPGSWGDCSFVLKRMITGTHQVFDLMEKLKKAIADVIESELKPFTDSGNASGISLHVMHGRGDTTGHQWTPLWTRPAQPDSLC
jgi:hypothetical protein